MRVNSIRVSLSEEELATLEQVRALGFSSDAEVLRCATLAWAEAAAQRPNDETRSVSGPTDDPPGTASPT